MKEISLDPRVNRMELPDQTHETTLAAGENWPTYEVFTQKKRGAQHTHAGIVHAPNPEMALVFAKEQFARRGQTVNVWVVPSSQVLATAYDDSDIFDTTPEKIHREAAAYKVRDKIEKYKEEHSNEQ
jgi:ring-1,2-phenylacetyl-CoA epoxidase subunit PaaB